MADQPKQVAKVVTISSLIAALPVLYAVQEYTDDRYVLRGETITLAQADEITHELKDASTKASANSQKLDWLLLDAAQNNVWAAEDRLERLKANQAQPADIRDAEKRLQKAQEYYECLLNDRNHCIRANGP